MNISRARNQRRLCLLLLPLLASCRNDQPAAPAVPLTAEQQDRKDLLRQPKPDWKPESAPRKLNILLISDKSKIRIGEAFHYRLEMQNVGRETLSFKESAPSFTKDGSLCGDNGYKFFVTPPQGKEQPLPCLPRTAEVVASTAPAREPDSGLELTLAPGEYMLTRSLGSVNRFRDLQTPFRFEALGAYRLKAVYAPKGGLRAVSNTVSVEVVP